MSYPNVTINVESNNLLRNIAVSDGVGAIVATASVAANKGVIKIVYSLQEAVTKGYTETEEPFLYNLIRNFYQELGGNQKLWVLGVDAEMKMANMVDSTEMEGLVKLLNAAAGEVNLVAIARKPIDGYTGGSNFMDADVQAAVLASLSLCQNQQEKNQPIRLFIEGRVANVLLENNYKPKTASNNFASVVLGNIVFGEGDNKSYIPTVSIALARACKYPAHIKLGSGQNGALAVDQIYIGNTRLEERTDMETLHEAGYLTFQKRAGIAGYYFGVDNMCSNDDFNILARGRIIDKAQRVVAAAYAPYIEDFIRVNADGTINSTNAKHLEDVLSTSILANMGEQISDVDVIIDPEQDIINSSNLQVQVKVLPLGYLTWITVTLGLTTKIS